MFIEQGIKKENEFWRYILGSIVAIAASFIGQIPLFIAIFIKSLKKGNFPTTNEEVMSFLDKNTTLFFMLLSFVFAIAGLFLVIKYFHNQTVLSVTTSRPKVDYKRILVSFLIWSLVSLVFVIAQYYATPNELIWNFKPIPFAILAIIALVLIPIQTSTEEYVFRGYLMQGFGNLSKNKWFPLVMTSLLFGTMHILNPEVSKMGYSILFFYIGTGFFLGILTLMDEGMELSLGFHAANNLVAALLVTSDWSVFQTNALFKDTSDPTAGFQIVLPVLVVFPLLLLVYSKLYKWSDWKEKLAGKIQIPIN